LFRAPGRRSPEEIATAQKKAAQERRSREQTMKANAEKLSRDIQRAAQLEDALAKKRKEAEYAFPRRRSGMSN
jgi:hypothetical protein